MIQITIKIKMIIEIGRVKGENIENKVIMTEAIKVIDMMIKIEEMVKSHFNRKTIKRKIIMIKIKMMMEPIKYIKIKEKANRMMNKNKVQISKLRMKTKKRKFLIYNNNLKMLN
jgi:hypothetical protein